MSAEAAQSFASRRRDILAAVASADVNLAHGAGDGPPIPRESLATAPDASNNPPDDADRSNAVRGIAGMSAFLAQADNPLILGNIGTGQDSSDDNDPAGASSSCPSVN